MLKDFRQANRSQCGDVALRSGVTSAARAEDFLSALFGAFSGHPLRAAIRRTTVRQRKRSVIRGRSAKRDVAGAR